MGFANNSLFYQNRALSMIGKVICNRVVTSCFLKEKVYLDKIKSDWFYVLVCDRNHQVSLRGCELHHECKKCFSPPNKIHGQSYVKPILKGFPCKKTDTYALWKRIRGKCYNPFDANYKWFGGQGIKICDEWIDFQVFYEEMGDKPENMSLELVDRNIHFSKSNCRWTNTTILNGRKFK